MKTCNNCLWYDKCDHAARCEFYDPIEGADTDALHEYNAYLKQMAQEDEDTINDQNS